MDKCRMDKFCSRVRRKGLGGVVRKAIKYTVTEGKG